RRGQGDGHEADGPNAVHRVRLGRWHTGVHEPGTGGVESTRHRHKIRHLFAGRAALRITHGYNAAATEAAQGSGGYGGGAGDSRGGTTEAEHAAEYDRRVAVDRGQPRDRAEKAEWARSRGTRLDRHEVPGKRPQPALRDRERARDGLAALLGRRGGAGLPAIP